MCIVVIVDIDIILVAVVVIAAGAQYVFSGNGVLFNLSIVTQVL